MSLSRPWLALVLALFCLPLFIGLGRADFQNDEAIYSFGVDRILEIGDWLAPQSSPHEDAVFLEKPPLKFWIVAAPIRFGLLPHSEFGIRFWDALFGAVAFLYVFAIGSRLAGPVCGAVAMLILFVHSPLMFDHGLRRTTWKRRCSCATAAAYFTTWPGASTPEPTPVRRRHRGAGHGGGGRSVLRAGLHDEVRGRIVFTARARDRERDGSRLSTEGVQGVAALDRRRGSRPASFAPWFIYANVRFGSHLWAVILGAHVVTRFTSYLDPAHLYPWYYYLRAMYLNFEASGTEVLVGLGVLVLLVQTIRRRSVEGLLILLWFALPVFTISLGTSKLYHYAYPFLPPLALAAGYLAALVVMLAPVPFDRLLSRLHTRAAARLPRVAAALQRPRARAVLLAISAASIGLALVTLVYGPVRIDFHGHTVFRSSGILRPITRGGSVRAAGGCESNGQPRGRSAAGRQRAAAADIPRHARPYEDGQTSVAIVKSMHSARADRRPRAGSGSVPRPAGSGHQPSDVLLFPAHPAMDSREVSIFQPDLPTPLRPATRGADPRVGCDVPDRSCPARIARRPRFHTVGIPANGWAH